MSLRRWSTSLERQQLNTSILNLLEGQSAVVDRMLHSSSSSSSSQIDSSIISRNSSIASSSSSSITSSSSSSSSSDDNDYDNTSEDDSIEDQEESLLRLSIDVQTQASIVFMPFQDHSVHWGRGPVVSDLSQSDCIENCRMRKEHLSTVCNKLWQRMRHLFVGNKSSIQCENRYTTHFETGMIVLLYRMSRPRRLRPEMEQSLKIRKSKLSSIIQTFSRALYNFAIPFLSGATLWHHRMPYYAKLIENKTNGLMDCVWGFIDGTIRKTARPVYHQRSVYTRFKKCHGVKFQSVTVPDGYIAYLMGPWPAQTHDARMLRESQLLDELQAIMPPNADTAVYALYGDLAYAQSIYLLGGFRKPQTGSNEAVFNRHMSSVRITVEWGFGDIVEKWKFLDFRSAMKIFEMPVGEYYTNGAFLSNICNCLYGNKTQQYFGARQLSLDEYLDLVVEGTGENSSTTTDEDVSI